MQKSGTKAIPRPMRARSMSRSLLLSSISGTRSRWERWNMEWRNSLVVLFRSSIMIGYSFNSSRVRTWSFRGKASALATNTSWNSWMLRTLWLAKSPELG